MKRRLLLAAAAAIALSAGAAHATIVSGTYSGNFTSGTDTSGVFFTPGTDLTGAAFSATFSFDTTHGMVQNTFSPLTGDAIGGGFNILGFGNSSPGGGTFTVNGVTINLTADGSLLQVGDAGGGQSVASLNLYDQTVSGANFAVFSFVNSTLPTDFTAFSGDPCAGATYCFGQFVMAGSVGGLFSTDAYSISASDVVIPTPPTGGGGGGGGAGGVPEPATWAMLIFGCGAIGAALRRRAAYA